MSSGSPRLNTLRKRMREGTKPERRSCPFLRMKWSETIARLATCDTPVAIAAPLIPRWSGKTVSQSPNTFSTVAMMTDAPISPGEPSFRQKLWKIIATPPGIRKTEYQRMSSRTIVWDVAFAPRSVASLRGKNTPAVIRRAEMTIVAASACRKAWFAPGTSPRPRRIAVTVVPPDTFAPQTLYGDTDSVFNRPNFRDKKTGEPVSGPVTIMPAIVLGQLTSKLIQARQPYPEELSYEKVF